jgi:hypothetical protein
MNTGKSLAAPSHLIRRGLRRAPVLRPGAGRVWGQGPEVEGPQNARHPHCDFSGNPKRVRGCYELAFRSLPHFLGVNLRELRPNGVLGSSGASFVLCSTYYSLRKVYDAFVTWLSRRRVKAQDSYLPSSKRGASYPTNYLRLGRNASLEAAMVEEEGGRWRRAGISWRWWQRREF